jgi:hypothetical protein
MTVESVEYINDLEPDRPRGSDRISQGDDHIRNIKKGLKQTFPNVSGMVSASDEEMNYLVGLTGPIKDEIDAGANDISQLQADVAKNKNDIASNSSDIASNSSDIADHDSRISANTQSISSIDLNKAEKSYVDSQNASQDAVISGKADKSYVDSQDALKADKSDSYSKAQIDALIAEASKGGVMIKIVKQPSSAGSFSLSSNVERGGQGYSKIMGSETSTLTLNVPNGMVFCLQGITAYVSTGLIRMQSGNILIDGVDVNGALTTNIEWAAGEDHIWPNGQNCAPIRVEGSVQLRDVYSNGQGSPQIIIQGYFVEA